MNEDKTARLALPLLHPGQANREETHNEALTLVDLALHGCVKAIGVVAPPATPAEGDCWIVGAIPTGAWTGQAGAIAGWTAGGWRFVAPFEGLTVWSEADALVARHRSGNWVLGEVTASTVRVGGIAVLGAQAAAIAETAGGTTVDQRARATIAAILVALRNHGLIAR